MSSCRWPTASPWLAGATDRLDTDALMVGNRRSIGNTESLRAHASVDDHLNITRPDQLHALGDPTRWRILGRLSEAPATVQELARALGIAKGTVAHHVRVLNTSGLVRVAETKRIRGVVEKRYARVARQFRLDEGDRELLAREPAIRRSRTCRCARRWQRPAERRRLPRRPLDVPRSARAHAGRACPAIRQARRGARGGVRRWRAGRGRDLRIRRRRLRPRLGEQRSRAPLDVARDRRPHPIRRAPSWRPP